MLTIFRAFLLKCRRIYVDYGSNVFCVACVYCILLYCVVLYCIALYGDLGGGHSSL